MKKTVRIFQSFFYGVFFAAAMPFSVGSVMADNISYDYAQADYISDTIDLAGSISAVQGNGIGFAVSLSFAPALAVKLAVASTTFRDFHGVRVDDAKVTTLGVTGHVSVASATDVFTNVSLIKAEITKNDGVDSASGSDYSVTIDLGLRHRLTDKIELETRLSHVKVFAYTLNSSMIGGRFYFRKRLSVGAAYVANDVHDSLLISARMDI